jgi:hypothetical protein
MRRAFAAALLCLALTGPAAGDARADFFTNDKYQAAAKKTAAGRLCRSLQPFYWEIGTTQKIEVNGSFGQADPRTGMPLGPRQQNLVGSAGAFLASAFLIEQALEKQQKLTAAQIDLLRLRSPHTAPDGTDCTHALTVKSCFGNMGGARKMESGKTYPFYFGAGHMQRLAMDLGLGDTFASHLRENFIDVFGRENYYGVSYVSARLFDGMRITPEGYARFLRDTMAGRNKMSGLLGSHTVCAYDAGDCAADVAFTAAPADKRWRYSLGHWVETDETRGRNSFSAFSREGYYVWISADKKHYGLVAPLRPERMTKNAARDLGIDTIDCGRAIREAFYTGIEQTRSEKPCETSNTLCWDQNPLR